MSASFSLRVSGTDIVVNMADSKSVLDQVEYRLRQGVGFAIATLNLDHLVKLRSMDAFRQAYARQDLVTADGNPIVWLSRLARRPVSLVPGSDLVEPLARLAAREGVPVALLGATQDTLDRAARHLTDSNPGLQGVACLAPSRAYDPLGTEAGEMVAALRASGARLTFLALGAPKQEIFAARCRAELPDVGFASVGAGLDFLASSQRRAPQWMRRAALEWAWRMMSDPRRLGRRYASCAILLPAMVLGVVSRGIRL